MIIYQIISYKIQNVTRKKKFKPLINKNTDYFTNKTFENINWIIINLSNDIISNWLSRFEI